MGGVEWMMGGEGVLSIIPLSHSFVRPVNSIQGLSNEDKYEREGVGAYPIRIVDLKLCLFHRYDPYPYN